MRSTYIDHEYFHGKPFSNVIAGSSLVALDFKMEVTAGAHKRLLSCRATAWARAVQRYRPRPLRPSLHRDFFT